MTEAEIQDQDQDSVDQINSCQFVGRPEPQPEVIRCVLNNLPVLMPYILESIKPVLDAKIASEVRGLVAQQYEELDSCRHAKISLEMDNLRQENKNSNLRISGIPENVPSTRAVCDIMTKMDLNADENQLDTYRLGKAQPNDNENRKPRAIIVKFKDRESKLNMLRGKAKIKEDLKKRKIGIFEDLTKARREMLSVVRDRHPSAHTRNGTVCFYDKRGNLVFIRDPNMLYQHGFTMAEVMQCEDAFKIA